jgi:hypothetical protein
MARREAMKTNGVRRMAARVASAVREMNEAQRRMIELRRTADWLFVDPSMPPNTYAEFLMSTSGPLRHEPSAAKRAAQR